MGTRRETLRSALRTAKRVVFRADLLINRVPRPAMAAVVGAVLLPTATGFPWRLSVVGLLVLGGIAVFAWRTDRGWGPGYWRAPAEARAGIVPTDLWGRPLRPAPRPTANLTLAALMEPAPTQRGDR